MLWFVLFIELKHFEYIDNVSYNVHYIKIMVVLVIWLPILLFSYTLKLVRILIKIVSLTVSPKSEKPFVKSIAI